MARDGAAPKALRVDGGMVANNWLMQFLADMLALPVERPKIMETTALGAAFLAGLKAGVYSSTDDIARIWAREARFEPTMGASDRAGLMAGWKTAVRRALV